MHYVLDTSILLSDPKAIQKLASYNLVIPIIVLKELETKRSHPELGYAARSALRLLEDCRKKTGRLDRETFFDEGGSIRVELNHRDDSSLPGHLKDNSNDSRILAVAYNLSKEQPVTLLAKDLPLRLHAASIGLDADDFDFEKILEIKQPDKIELNPNEIDELYEKGSLNLDLDFNENAPVLATSPFGQSALALARNGKLEVIRSNKPYGLAPKNAMQTFALHALADDSISIVSLGGLAGSGKTVMALASGLEAVQRRNYNKVIVFRPIYSVGGQDLGFLPGTAEEKMAPWAEAVYDAMQAFMRPNEIENCKRQRQIEVLPLTHIRGRTISNSFIIIDEAQNLDLMVLVTALSRLGHGSKIVLTHDLNQRDNLRVGKHDGIAKVISKLSSSNLFCHISLNKSERSAVAQLIADNFEI